MFASLGSFSVFFFTCLALIVLGIVFEDKLIAIVEKHDAKKNRRKEKAK